MYKTEWIELKVKAIKQERIKSTKYISKTMYVM